MLVMVGRAVCGVDLDLRHEHFPFHNNAACDDSMLNISTQSVFHSEWLIETPVGRGLNCASFSQTDFPKSAGQRSGLEIGSEYSSFLPPACRIWKQVKEAQIEHTEKPLG